jgi:hypothetical protein
MTSAINDKAVRRELYKKGHDYALEFLKREQVNP